jgi:hypothetical protein
MTIVYRTSAMFSTFWTCPRAFRDSVTHFRAQIDDVCSSTPVCPHGRARLVEANYTLPTRQR